MALFPGDYPLLLVAPRHAPDLARVLAPAGFTFKLYRALPENLSQEECAGMACALVDLRGAWEAGLSAVVALHQQITSKAAKPRLLPIAALIDKQHRHLVRHVVEAGASHFLLSPYDDEQLLSLLLAAGALATTQGYAGTFPSAAHPPSRYQAALLAPIEHASWRYDPGQAQLSLSTQAAQILGQRPDRPLSLKSYLAAMPASDALAFQAAMARALAQEVPIDVEVVFCRYDGEETRIHHRITRQSLHERENDYILSADLLDTGWAASMRGLAAQLDPMTGLPAEASARQWVRQVLQDTRSAQPPSARAPDQLVGAVLVGVSRLERINMAYGRTTADQLMVAIARRLRRLMREEGAMALHDNHLLSRLTGAEFIVLQGAPFQLQDLVFLAQILAGAFAKPYVIEGDVIHLSCRIGIATLQNRLEDADQLFRKAAAALAQAKTQEPNSYSIYEEETTARSVANRSMETQLYSAIQDDGLQILYQPQVDIATNALAGVEALVRWLHPTLGEIRPDTFLEVAQHAEMLPMLGEAVLRRAMLDLGQLSAGVLARLRLAVNVDPVQLRRPDFEERVLQLLSQTGFSANRLTLEITESAVIDNIEQAARFFSRLRARGVRVAIDDFGTGHASYAYLKSLPFDYLKLDKSFISQVSQDRRDRAMVRAIIEMAKTLGMAVVAEGVETQEQLSYLSTQGCTIYQGYLCAAPLPPEQLGPFAQNWQKA
jgi:diguanylate cyclase (GGDEF)-like protein